MLLTDFQQQVLILLCFCIWFNNIVILPSNPIIVLYQCIITSPLFKMCVTFTPSNIWNFKTDVVQTSFTVSDSSRWLRWMLMSGLAAVWIVETWWFRLLRRRELTVSQSLEGQWGHSFALSSWWKKEVH